MNLIYAKQLHRTLIWSYTKHHSKFGKNQADNLVAVFNRFIWDFGADFFLYFIGV